MANPNPSPATRFRPGGPPGPGRPKSRPLTDRLRAALDDPEKADTVLRQWLAMIAAGDSGALRELLNRLEGKVTDRIEHDGQVTIRVEYDDAPQPDAAAEAEADEFASAHHVDAPAPEAAPETG